MKKLFLFAAAVVLALSFVATGVIAQNDRDADADSGRGDRPQQKKVYCKCVFKCKSTFDKCKINRGARTQSEQNNVPKEQLVECQKKMNECTKVCKSTYREEPCDK